MYPKPNQPGFISLSFTVIAMVIFTCSCGDTILSDEEADKVIKEARETLMKYNDDIRQNGLFAEFKYLDSTDQFHWHPPGYGSPLSFDSIAGIIRESAAGFTSVDNTWDSLTILPMTKNKAMYVGVVKSNVTDTAGIIHAFRFREEGTMIKREDGWKLLSGKTVATL